jgi:hypothetical protein
MSEDVSIAIAERTLLKWPQRCPRCGSTMSLVERRARFSRLTPRRRPGKSALDYFITGNIVSRHWLEDVRLQVPVLTCREHARANQLGGALLFHGPLSTFFRASIYVGVVAYVLVGALCLFGDAKAVPPLAEWPAKAFAYAAWSIAGAAAIAWARHVAWARPLRIDGQYQVVTLRFRDGAYAREFRAMNPVETTKPPVSSTLVNFLRMTPTNIVLLIALGVVGIAAFLRIISP